MRLRRAAISFIVYIQTLGLFLAAPVAMAQGTGGLTLVRLLPDPAAPLTDAHDEFVELRNTGSSPVALSDYSLRVGTATHHLAAQSVPAGGSVTISSAQAAWALGNAGGTLALLDATAHELESTTWPKAVTGATWSKAAGGTWSWAGAPAASSTPSVAGATSSDDEYPDVELNELLPDPASPLTDARDEFIEVYNPGSAPVDLAGYVIKTGASLTTKHTLARTIAPAAGYVALTSGDTKVALSNSGTSVALFDPAGRQVGTTITYSKAKSGQAWGRFDGHWAWTTTPTAGAANVLSEPPAAATATGATAKKASATKTAAATAKKAKPTTTKAASSTKAATKTPMPLVASTTTSGGHWLLFALAGLTIAYIIYEFRYDIRNLYFRFRGHPGSGRAPGQALEGRGSHRAG